MTTLNHLPSSESDYSVRDVTRSLVAIVRKQISKIWDNNTPLVGMLAAWLEAITVEPLALPDEANEGYSAG